MFRRNLRVTAVLLLLVAKIALGQAGTADLTGIVSDSAGALLSNARVTATDAQTDVSIETRSGTGGVFVFTNLHPSVYTVTAEADGFQKLVRTGVTLPTAERPPVALPMPVGSVKETVTGHCNA